MVINYVSMEPYFFKQPKKKRLLTHGGTRNDIRILVGNNTNNEDIGAMNNKKCQSVFLFTEKYLSKMNATH